MTTQAEVCPICGEGHLHARIGEQEVEHRSHSEQIAFQYSECDFCGSEQASADQLRDNKRLMIAFKKRVDGLLSGAEIRALREKLEITQGQAARVFGGGPVAFAKYEADDVTQSESMDRLLRLAMEVPTAWQWLSEHAGVPLKGAVWITVEQARPAGKDRQPNHLRVVAKTDLDGRADYRSAA